MYYKNYTRRAYLKISFWHLLMSFEKPKKKQNFEKNEKKKKKYWRYHDFTHVYQKPQSGTVRDTA